MIIKSLNNKYLQKIYSIKDLNYIPVGLGTNEFSNLWLKDDTKDNISKKNPFYGEYTFHYWLWKNMIDDIPEKTWIGFCGYRYFWKQENLISNENKKSDILNILSVINFGLSDRYKTYVVGGKINLNLI